MLRNLIIHAISVAIAAYVIDSVSISGGFTLVGFMNLMLVTVILTFINACIRPILKLISLPITILTLGLFSFFINGLMVLLVDKLLDGFTTGGLLSAILFSIVMSVVHIVLSIFEEKD